MSVLLDVSGIPVLYLVATLVVLTLSKAIRELVISDKALLKQYLQEKSRNLSEVRSLYPKRDLFHKLTSGSPQSAVIAFTNLLTIGILLLISYSLTVFLYANYHWGLSAISALFLALYIIWACLETVFVTYQHRRIISILTRDNLHATYKQIPLLLIKLPLITGNEYFLYYKNRSVHIPCERVDLIRTSEDLASSFFSEGTGIVVPPITKQSL